MEKHKHKPKTQKSSEIIFMLTPGVEDCKPKIRITTYICLTVRSTEWSVSDQIHFFQNAELIVAPHGAGLSNIVFANPECRIIEINQSNYFNPCFSALHSCMEFRGIYDHYIAPPKTNNKKDTNSKHNQKTRVNNAKLIDLIMT